MPQLSTIIDLLSHFKPLSLVRGGTVSQPLNTLKLGDDDTEYKIVNIPLLQEFERAGRKNYFDYKGMETHIAIQDASASKTLSTLFDLISQPNTALGEYTGGDGMWGSPKLVALYELDQTGDESQWSWKKTVHPRPEK